jgi:Rod binding domain-containing protein
MSISPPQDIILDVAKAADPARYRLAVERLNRLAPSRGPAFETLLAAPVDEMPPTTAAAARPLRVATASHGVPAAAAKAYRGFEAMALSTFIEAALPQDGSAVFGAGTAGGVWKSMLAEQIAMQMAKSGGIGIADQLAAQAQRTPEATAGPRAAAESPFDPKLLTMTAERRFLGALAPRAQADALDEPSSS